MADDNFFPVPFAQDGDRTDIPASRPVDNSVNLLDGFGFDYEKEPPAPGYKFIEREKFNGLMHQTTSAVRDVQLHGSSDWQPAVVNLGGYEANAIVWHAGQQWQSQVSNNGVEPGTEEGVADPQWLTLPESIAATLPPTPSTGGNPISIDGPLVVTKGSSANYTITDYDSFLPYTVSTSVGTISRSGATITLTIPAGSPSAAAVMTISRDGVPETREVALGEQSIAQPTITSPSSGSVNVSVAPTITASAFATYPAGVDTHLNSNWFIRNAGGTIIYQSLNDTINKTSITIPAGSLQPGTQYFATVSYRGATLGLSQVSPAVQFTTIAQSINTPAILTPANGATNIGETPTVTSSVFATTPSGVDTHASTNWRLKNQVGTVVWSLNSSTSNKTSVTIPAGILQTSSTYTIEAQYNGSSLPSSSWSAPNQFVTASAFAYENYLVVPLRSSPYLAMYGINIDTLVKLPDPSVMPTGQGMCASFTADGQYVAVGHFTSPFLSIYKRSGDVFTKLANPASLPAGGVQGCSFSRDGQYLAICGASGNRLEVYKRSSDVFTKLPSISGITSEAASCAFSPDSQYLAVATITTPFINVYKRSGDVFTKLGTPSGVPSSATGTDVDFSPDGQFLALAHAFNPGLTMWRVTAGDTFTLFTSGGPATTAQGRAVSFSADSGYAVQSSVGTGSGLSLLKRSSSSFSVVQTITPGTTSCVFSGSNQHVAAGYSSAPFLKLFKQSGDTLSQLANPSSLPTSEPGKAAFFPRT